MLVVYLYFFVFFCPVDFRRKKLSINAIVLRAAVSVSFSGGDSVECIRGVSNYSCSERISDLMPMA